MPISSLDFMRLEPYGPTVEDKVRVFLEQRHDSAFTPSEVAEGLFRDQLLANPNFVESVREILESLRLKDLVEARLNRTSTPPEIYYMMTQRDH